MKKDRWQSVNWEWNDARIAKRMNISREAVRQQRAKRGIERSPSWHKTADRLESILNNMLTAGMTPSQIAKAAGGYDVSYTKSVLKKMEKPFLDEDRRTSNRKYPWHVVSRADWIIKKAREIAEMVGVGNLAIVAQRKKRELAKMSKVAL